MRSRSRGRLKLLWLADVLPPRVLLPLVTLFHARQMFILPFSVRLRAHCRSATLNPMVRIGETLRLP
eukprot:14879545-Heterocapsa_arctica.AAC.1